MSHNHNRSRDPRVEEQPTVQTSPLEDEAVHESPIQDVPQEKLDAPATEPPVEECPSAVLCESPSETVIVSGTVTDCEKLNVRSNPDGTDPDNVITTINALSEVEVNVKESTDTFFKIRTADGIEGFCMREYIFLHQ